MVRCGMFRNSPSPSNGASHYPITSVSPSALAIFYIWTRVFVFERCWWPSARYGIRGLYGLPVRIVFTSWAYTLILIQIPARHRLTHTHILFENKNLIDFQFEPTKLFGFDWMHRLCVCCVQSVQRISQDGWVGYMKVQINQLRPQSVIRRTLPSDFRSEEDLDLKQVYTIPFVLTEKLNTICCRE